MLKRKTNFYVVTFRNIGGLVMPVIVRVHYADNTSELMKFPAELWTGSSQQVDKLIVSEKEISRLELDPRRETADAEPSNNHWPPKLVPSRFKLFKDQKKKNEMQKFEDDQANGENKKQEPEAKPKDMATEKTQ